MVRTSRKQRYAMLAVSAAIVGGGTLIPTSAFAATTTAPTTQHAATGQVDHTKNDHRNNQRHNDKNKKNQKHQGKKNKVRDVENMPGCKFYQGKVYCEHKPEKPATKTDPAAPDRETGKAPAPAPAPK